MSAATIKETGTMTDRMINGASLMNRMRLMVAAMMLAWGALSLAMSTAEAAETPAPAWTMQITSTPTNFSPGAEAQFGGPLFQIVATNVGSAPTSGIFTITAELPQGVTVSNSQEPRFQYGRAGAEKRPECQVNGRTVTCTGGTEASYVPPNLNAEVKVYVDVAASEGETLEMSATVEGGGAAAVTKSNSTLVSATPADFGYDPGGSALSGTAANRDGSASTRAGSHPGIYKASAVNVTQRANIFGQPRIPDGEFRNVRVDLPRGMIVNPQAAPKCTEAQLEVGPDEYLAGGGCPEGSTIGMITLNFSFGESFHAGSWPLYNMIPPAGEPAEFGFSFIGGIYNHIKGFVRTGDDYGLSAVATDIPSKLAIAGLSVTLWGDPTSSDFDEVRGHCFNQFYAEKLCLAEEQLDTPFVSFPSDCRDHLTSRVFLDTWIHPHLGLEGSFDLSEPNGNLLSLDGCNQLPFDPSVEVKPTTNLADAPTGLDFKLHVPQSEGLEAPSTANVKDVKVTLPEGLTVNPSSSDGLGVCTAAQIELDGPNPATCPDDAKIGTTEITTPLLTEPLHGAVYLAKPFENKFNSLIAVYIAVADPQTGVVLKLPGVVEPNPSTGQLVATFKENPELPFSDLKVSFFNGARASLTSPATCGTHTTNATVTPWSTPEGADALRSDSFATSVSQTGGECPTSEAGLPDQISFDAGTTAPKAGAFSPFLLRITRPDGSQRITAIDTTLPPGLTGKLAGIPYCPEASIAAAAARSNPNEGAAEKASPSCPAASEVGRVNVGAGSGPNPVYVGGHVYLAGPYKGAPLSFVVITPAVAGPFDLGNVVTRIALNINPETARIHAVSDPLPTILHGIPLDVRSIALKLDRQGFTLNPTSCDPMAIAAAVTSSAGHESSLSSRFQVGACSALAFKPKLWLKLKGGTKRSKYPSLTAILTQPPGQANIGKVSVTLPHSTFLEQAHIGTVCTRVQFAEGAVPGEKCPARSIYGKAKAFTPLLDKPISGPVFLRSSSHELPDLVAALHGQVDVVVVGRVDSVKGRLRNSFEAVPDAPVSKFVLQMQGGKRGLVVNSTNLCKGKQRATLKMRGQNGKEFEARPLVRNSCKTKQRKHNR